ncbi:MAG: HRDC domain-containing protein [Pseudomonadota bacterium]
MSQHRIAAVERKFVEDGANSFWALCISVERGGQKASGSVGKRSSVDYREVLNETDFAIFSQLRALRKQLAEREGVPPYAIFTNEQLAKIVQGRVLTKAALKDIDGIGDARVEKYAAPFLSIMASSVKGENNTTEDAEDAP